MLWLEASSSRCSIQAHSPKHSTPLALLLLPQLLHHPKRGPRAQTTLLGAQEPEEEQMGRHELGSCSRAFDTSLATPGGSWDAVVHPPRARGVWGWLGSTDGLGDTG